MGWSGVRWKGLKSGSILSDQQDQLSRPIAFPKDVTKGCHPWLPAITRHRLSACAYACCITVAEGRWEHRIPPFFFFFNLQLPINPARRMDGGISCHISLHVRCCMSLRPSSCIPGDRACVCMYIRGHGHGLDKLIKLGSKRTSSNLFLCSDWIRRF